MSLLMIAFRRYFHCRHYDIAMIISFRCMSILRYADGYIIFRRRYYYATPLFSLCHFAMIRCFSFIAATLRHFRRLLSRYCFDYGILIAFASYAIMLRYAFRFFMPMLRCHAAIAAIFLHADIAAADHCNTRAIFYFLLRYRVGAFLEPLFCQHTITPYAVIFTPPLSCALISRCRH